jgi:hypothetical protein
LLCGCRSGGSAGSDDAGARASASTSEAASASSIPSSSAGAAAPLDGGADDATRSDEPAWRRAARNRDWRGALQLLRALPEAERQRPEIRLVLGRAALAAGEHALSVSALRGLGAEQPSVRDEAELWYAQAAAVAGPWDEAAGFLARSSRVEDLILAADAYLRAGKAALARNTIDTAVARAERLRHGEDQTHARMTRAAMAEQAGQTTVSLVDWRWVVSNRPDDPAARQALDGLGRIKATVSLDVELVDAAERCAPSAALARCSTPATIDRRGTPSTWRPRASPPIAPKRSTSPPARQRAATTPRGLSNATAR